MRIGTRKSPLALAQTHEAVAALKASGLPGDAIEIVSMHTIGDKVVDRPLVEIGGKGLFSKELDKALQDHRIDAAVHSAKDLESTLTEGITIAATLPREDPSDLLISPHAETLEALPKKAVFGTSSVRRAAMILARRPDLQIVPFRGNLDTRLRKLANGEAQATILAAAGLKRLKRAVPQATRIPHTIMLPASGQGIVAITCRTDDHAILKRLEALNHTPSMAQLLCERSVLRVVDGTCRTPIGAFSRIDNATGTITVQAALAALDGGRIEQAEGAAPLADAEALGQRIGQSLKTRFPDHA